MRVGLLGDDPRIVPFLEAILRSGRLRLTTLVQAPRCAAAVRDLAVLAEAESWEELLPDDVCQAVIVASDSPDLLEGARQLAAADKLLLVWPSHGQSSEFVYQLSLMHAEQKLNLLPLQPLRTLPAVASLRDKIRTEIGPFQHLRLERVIPVTRSGGFTIRDFASAFLLDADLLLSLGGEYDQISASRTGTVPVLSFASATLSGETCPPSMWTLSTGPESVWTLTVAGERGSAVLKIAGDPLVEAGSLTVRTAEGVTLVASAEESPRAWAERLVRQCETVGGGKQTPTARDLARLFELLEAFDRSVDRRRTIDVHFDLPSERTVFKSQMAAAGCSVLVLTLIAAVLYLAVSALVPLPRPVQYLLWALVFLPLFAFLGLQGFILFARPAARDDRKEPEKTELSG